MNAKQIKEYFENPEKMDAAALISLQQAVQDFPYASALQMLYMKVLKSEDSYQLPSQVKRAAISVPDPALLKHFYDSSNKEELPTITFDVDALKAQAKPKEKKKKLQSENSKKKISLKREEVKKASKSLVTKEEKVESSKNQVAKSVAPKSETGSLDHLPEKVRNAITRSRELNSSSLKKSYETAKVPATENDIEAQQKSKKVVPVEQTKKEGSTQQKREKPKDLELAEMVNPAQDIQESEDIRIMPFSEKASFLQWLNADHYVEVKKIDATQEFAKIEVVEDHEQAADGEIRKIIQQLPKFESNLDGKINVFNLEADKEGRFVTETLAEIYFNQRVFDKAIKAYEVLSLKYPEKSSFFADRIRAIKKEKNS